MCLVIKLLTPILISCGVKSLNARRTKMLLIRGYFNLSTLAPPSMAQVLF
jgi:hypothetical protein